MRAKKANYLRFFWSKYSFILSSLIFSNSSLLRLVERFLLVFRSNSSLVSWSNSGKPEKSEDSFADLNLIRSKMKQAIKRIVAVGPTKSMHACGGNHNLHFTACSLLLVSNGLKYRHACIPIFFFLSIFLTRKQ